MRLSSGILITAATATAMLALAFSPVGALLEEKIAQPLAFSFRHTMGKDPAFDKRIKILSFDQNTMRTLGSPDVLGLSDWAYLVRGLAASKPNKIFIDKMFSSIAADPNGIRSFNSALTESGVPVVVGSNVPTTPSDSKENLDRTLLKKFEGKPPTPALPSKTRKVEGPDLRIAPSFGSIGHIQYQGGGRMKAGFFWDDNLYLPLFGILAASELTISENRLVANQTKIPLDSNGRIIVNLMPRSEYGKRSYSLVSALPFIQRREPITGISPGDTIVVLPLMYTGNVDFKDSPVGNIEGGYIQVANINSALTNSWITPVGESALARSLAIVFSALLGGVLAWRLSPLWALLGTIAIASTTIFSSLLAFSFMSFLIAWIQPTATFVFTSLFVLAERARYLEKHAQRVSNALEGLVSPNLLRTLKKDPELLKMEPKEIQATVMFVDIEGFSLRAEIRKPAQVFVELRDQLARVCDIVHKHNGIVDKTLGDGLLCFFGYSYDPNSSSSNHALDALNCAVEIQRMCADIAVQMGDAVRVGKDGTPQKSESAMPLRVGLNSGPVYLGNLGTGLRVDFTIVGDTVNFAKRLEDACETFRVMISKETRELLRRSQSSSEFTLPFGTALHRRMLSIKHHHELIEGWECDPFASEPDVFHKALKGARDRITRNAQRWAIPEDTPFHILVNRTENATLLNFSLSGIAIASQQYLARKVQVTVDVDSPDGELRKKLEAQNLLPLICLVRWGSPQSTSVHHGLQVVNLSAEQRETFSQLLLDDIKRRHEEQS